MQLAARGMRQCARVAGGGQGCLAHRSIVIVIIIIIIIIIIITRLSSRFVVHTAQVYLGAIMTHTRPIYCANSCGTLVSLGRLQPSKPTAHQYIT